MRSGLRVIELRGLVVLLSGVACAALLTVGCFGRSELDGEDPLNYPHAGGSSGAGGSATSGGSRTTGGARSTGGARATGGRASTGGFVSTGGLVAAGGATEAGGFVATGGVTEAGGFVATGGSGTGGMPVCSSITCSGCCNAAGVCLPGTGVNACGMQGGRCTDCGSSGFACDQGVCQGKAPLCAVSCDGCCDALGRCRLGTETDACGVKGSVCTVCSTSGASCSGGQCIGKPTTCDASNCGGCCDASGVCRTGTANGLCGAEGLGCENCSSEGRQCSEPGSYCAFLPSCSATTCPNGCCDASGVCHDGRADAACGTSGQACSQCAKMGLVCAPSGYCYNGLHCGADTCAGCCGADGQCRPGTGVANCGRFGSLCERCSSTGETCQAGACGIRGNTCPAAYGGCNPGAATSPPTNGASCDSSTLPLLPGACMGAKNPADCLAGLRVALASNQGCFDCLQQFLYDGAVAKCLAPFLSPTCNHQYTCYDSCLTGTCGGCADISKSGCEGAVSNPAGYCGDDVSGSYCAAAAFSGPAGFCNLRQIGDIGVWLQGVATYYCSR